MIVPQAIKKRFSFKIFARYTSDPQGFVRRLKRVPLELIRMCLDRPAVVIFSLGKAGTSSILTDVIDQTSLAVVQVHHLSEGSKGYDSLGIYDDWKRAFALKKLKESNTIVIACVRDSFSRAISSVRQNYFLYETDQDLEERIIENALGISSNWWTEEFFAVTGWNIYEQDFEPNVGCGEYRLPSGATLLVIKQEYLSTTGAAELSKYLGKPIAFGRSNAGSKKRVGEGVHATLADYRFPRDVGSSILTSKFMTFFYSQAERDALEAVWVKK